MNSPEIPDSCPFCGSVVSVLADGKPCRAADGDWVHFKCLTSMHMGQDPRMCQSRPCEEAERQRLTTEVDMLRTANAGLVEKVKTLEEELEGHAWKVSPAMAQATIDGLVEKVKRLEEAGDAHREWVPVSFQKEWDEAKGQP